MSKERDKQMNKLEKSRDKYQNKLTDMCSKVEENKNLIDEKYKSIQCFKVDSTKTTEVIRELEALQKENKSLAGKINTANKRIDEKDDDISALSRRQ